MDRRETLLQTWGQYIANAAQQGALTGRPIALQRLEGIAGPRAGALEIQAGLDSGRLLRAFAKDDAALLRQFVPWNFAGSPVAYMAGRFVRIEAGWPDALAETLIRLSSLGHNPKGGGRWVVGKNEYGATIIPGLSDRTPHFLVSGATGSGKSVALRSAVLQLSRDPQNQLVLIDGKYGESLHRVAQLRGVVGPVAMDGPSVRAALGWACAEMRRRYENGGHEGRVVIVFDEIQEFVGDSIIVDLMRRIAAQGRTAHVHLIAATQHPTVAAFGDTTTRRNLTGKLALRVADPDASRVAVGGRLPRADHLLGAGDCYTVAPGTVHRVQVAFVDGHEIGHAEHRTTSFDTWPEYEAEAIGQTLPAARGWSYTGPELAVSIVAASEDEGRPALVKRLDAAGLGKPGAERAIRLLNLGRAAVEWLKDNGHFAGCLSGAGRQSLYSLPFQSVF